MTLDNIICGFKCITLDIWVLFAPKTNTCFAPENCVEHDTVVEYEPVLGLRLLYKLLRYTEVYIAATENVTGKVGKGEQIE